MYSGESEEISCFQGEQYICYCPKYPFNNCFIIPMQTLDVNKCVVIYITVYGCSAALPRQSSRLAMPTGASRVRDAPSCSLVCT
jgi:hypothetical protein